MSIATFRPASTRWPVVGLLSAALLWTATRMGAQAPNGRPLPPLNLAAHDVVVSTGGANVVAGQENGYLETLLALHLVDQSVRFRNMGWEGDTVYEQRRDLNFPPWPEQLKRVGATVIFAQFGQAEVLAGRASFPKFIAAYEKLLDQFARQTTRLVLVSPTPFETNQAPLPDLSAHNSDLRVLVEAIGQLAQKRRCGFIDLFTPLAAFDSGQRLTTDGLHLTPYGHWLAAAETVRQLRLPEAPKVKLAFEANETLSPSEVERLRQTILLKNRYWFDYWRPMNWAFLHGDRTEQPSSRDHRNPALRWFPTELEKFVPLIEAQERQAAELAQRIARPGNKRTD